MLINLSIMFMSYCVSRYVSPVTTMINDKHTTNDVTVRYVANSLLAVTFNAS